MPPQDSDLILAGLYPEIIKMIVNASDADLESLANMRMVRIQNEKNSNQHI